MLPIRTILHPTDFSDRSAHALHLACALSRDYGARLIVLHVASPAPLIAGEMPVPIDPEVHFQESEKQLTRLDIPDVGVRAERCFEVGDPTAEILRVAADIHADLVVLGTHGRTGLGRLLMGSVAEQVVRKAGCPVLTVKTPFAEHVTASVPEASLAAAGAH